MPDRVSVTFDGRPRPADPTRPLWLALSDDPLSPFQRSIRYHRPRAPLCGIGYCTQCIVRVNGQPNVRACQYWPRDGDVVETENAWPSPRLDVYGGIDVVFPRGLDTVHGFRWPAFFTPFYQRVVRRLAGFGRAPEGPTAMAAPGVRLQTDVLVVGRGVAGSAAAEGLPLDPAASLVVDPNGPGEDADSKRELRGRVVFLPPPSLGRDFPFEAIVDPVAGPAALVASRKVVLAPGGYDAHLVFPGNDRPGVVTADATEQLFPTSQQPPFRRALVFGGEERAQTVVERFPGSVLAVASPGPVTPELTRAASERGLRLYPRVLIAAAHGRRRVKSVTLAPRGSGSSITLAVDAIVLAHRRLPSPQLLFQAGARMHWDGTVGHYLPDIDSHGATSVTGLFAAGEVAGFRTKDAARSSGQAAALAASSPTSWTAHPTCPEEARAHPLEAYYRDLLRQRRGPGKCIVCSCEDVLLEEVEAASRAGYRGIEVIKRYTGVGTGLCQGRYCVPETLLLLSALERRPPAEVGYLTQRPPVVPVALGTLASLPAPED